MVMKAADFIHLGEAPGSDTVLLSRLQNAGAGGLNIPTETIKELGNYRAVGVVRDVPDLSFTVNSFDCSTELEKWITGASSMPVDGLDMTNARNADVVAHVKPGRLSRADDPFKAVLGIACPGLFPERIQYQFRVSQNSTLDMTLRGDTINYCPGATMIQTEAGPIAPSGSFVLDQAAGLYTNASGDTRILGLSVDGKRLTEGTDFWVTTPGSTAYETTTVHLVGAVITGSVVSVLYFTNATVTHPQSEHPTVATRPAAVRGRDVRVYVGSSFNPAASGDSASFRWNGVQSATVDWTVQIERDFELGEPRAFEITAQDVPTLSGQLVVRARDYANLLAKLRQITGVTDTSKAIGPDNAVSLALDLVVLDGDGAIRKRIHVDDARFSMPGYQPQVGQTVDITIPWVSDTAVLTVLDA